MKVTKNITMYMGNDDAVRERKMAQAQQDGKAQESKTVFAGALNQNKSTQSLIEQRRQQAQKKALKVVSDAWDGDRSIDDEMEKHREKARQLLADKQTEEGYVSDIRAYEKQMQAAYGIEDGSQEQKDAELLLKEQEEEFLTEDEKSRLEEVHKNGLTEYQSNLLELNEPVKDHKQTINQLASEIEKENATVQAIHLERLKHDPMLKAQEEADAIEDAASKEILGMLFEDGKEHVDEKQEEKTEQAKELEEKRKEQEERLEKRKEEREEIEELTEEIISGGAAGTGKSIAEVQQEVKDIVKKMKLVEEDIKGAKVDETI